MLYLLTVKLSNSLTIEVIQNRLNTNVSAWSKSHKLVLGQKKSDDKSNEITAIPALIEMLDIQDSIITIDAMGCQKKIASLLVKKKADYVLGLKGNQEKIYKKIKAFFNKRKSRSFLGK